MVRLLSSFAGLELRDYYAAACPHCQHLDPVWKEAATSYSGPVTFKQIECADESWKPVEENKEACADINGYPTIKLFNGDKEIAEYDGNRTASALKAFAKAHESVAAAAMPCAAAILAPPQVRTSADSAKRRAELAGFL
mmetsp:Transcript_124782/g.216399  ORF Transcript_124782/g.216399 Transcript_124782/m.216399 type:complete len:139 (-) Transcript_124782:60-476(-)